MPELFEWFRAFHIIGVIAWMAGLLIYPRLLVYRLEAAGNAGFEAAMDKAAAAAGTIILAPTMILTWLMGLAMIGQRWDYYSGQPWLWAKLVLVIVLSGIHGWLSGLGRKIAAGEKPIEPKRLRMLNELPMVIAMVIVLLVVLEPFRR
jgi:protoporphyrinogen IX oxidase